MVDLYSKFDHLLLKIERGVTCPKPPDEVIKKVKEDKLKKRGTI